MAGFEDSKIYKAAKVTYEAVSWFKSKAKTLQQSAVNSYTANAIENKKMVRSAMRSVKEGLISFKNTVVNKVEDKAFEAKGLAGKLKGRFNGWMNKLKANAQDKIDTAHYGLLVAQDKAKPILKTAANTFAKTGKNLQTVGKAGLNGMALGVGLTAAGMTKAYEAGSKFVGDKVAQAKDLGGKAVMNGMFVAGMVSSKVAKVAGDKAAQFKAGAAKLYQSAVNTYTGHAIENKKMVRSAMRSVKEGLTSFKNTVVNKVEDKAFEAKGLAGKLKGRFNGWMNKLKANTQDNINTARYGLLEARNELKPILKTAANTFAKTAKNLQTVGKAGLNGMALGVGLTAAGMAKTYEAGSKFVGDKVAQAKDLGEKAVMNGMFMAGMVSSKVSKVAGDKAAQFKAGAAKLYQSAVNTYTGHAIENKKMVRSAMRSVKEGLTSFKNTVVNKVEDKAFEAKGLVGKLKGRFNGWMNKLKANAQDNINTAHYGLLVAQDKAKPILKTAANTFAKTAKNLQTVGKAGLNGVALGVGLTAAGMTKAYEAGSKFVGDKVAQAKDLGEKAVMNGMFMAGMVSSKVSKVAGDKAAQFKAGANKVIMGGVGLAKNVVKNIENGSRNTVAKVGNTLTSVRTDINKGIAVAKTAVKEQARGNTAAWYRLGQMQGRS